MIEVDVKGQLKCEAKQFTLTGQEIPGGVNILNVIAILLNLAVGQVSTLAQAQKRQGRPVDVITSNGEEKEN